MWSNRLNLQEQKGQSLIEVLVVLAIAAIMIIALIMIILSSLKNAQFAQNQTQATKLAQDAIDKIRILRDKNNNNTLGSPRVCFNKLWDTTSVYCSTRPPNTYCYYVLDTHGNYLDNAPMSPYKDQLGNGFYRQIKISQPAGSTVTLIVEVGWADSSGDHSSNLETVLTKADYDCTD